jgi:hypothetical protein
MNREPNPHRKGRTDGDVTSPIHNGMILPRRDNSAPFCHAIRPKDWYQGHFQNLARSIIHERMRHKIPVLVLFGFISACSHRRVPIQPTFPPIRLCCLKKQRKTYEQSLELPSSLRDTAMMESCHLCRIHSQNKYCVSQHALPKCSLHTNCSLLFTTQSR